MDEIVCIFRLLQAQTDKPMVTRSENQPKTAERLLLLLRNLVGRIPFLLLLFISADQTPTRSQMHSDITMTLSDIQLHKFYYFSRFTLTIFTFMLS